MKITLSQDEIFESISDYLVKKLNLKGTETIEVSLTAGRSPKGYTADVEITYEKVESHVKLNPMIIVDDDPTAGDQEPPPADPVPREEASPVINAGNLFNS